MMGPPRSLGEVLASSDNQGRASTVDSPRRGAGSTSWSCNDSVVTPQFHRVPGDHGVCAAMNMLEKFGPAAESPLESELSAIESPAVTIPASLYSFCAEEVTGTDAAQLGCDALFTPDTTDQGPSKTSSSEASDSGCVYIAVRGDRGKITYHPPPSLVDPSSSEPEQASQSSVESVPGCKVGGGSQSSFSQGQRSPGVHVATLADEESSVCILSTQTSQPSIQKADIAGREPFFRTPMPSRHSKPLEEGYAQQSTWQPQTDARRASGEVSPRLPQRAPLIARPHGPNHHQCGASLVASSGQLETPQASSMPSPHMGTRGCWSQGQIAGCITPRSGCRSPLEAALAPLRRVQRAAVRPPSQQSLRGAPVALSPSSSSPSLRRGCTPVLDGPSRSSARGQETPRPTLDGPSRNGLLGQQTPVLRARQPLGQECLVSGARSSPLVSAQLRENSRKRPGHASPPQERAHTPSLVAACLSPRHPAGQILVDDMVLQSDGRHTPSWSPSPTPAVPRMRYPPRKLAATVWPKESLMKEASSKLNRLACHNWASAHGGA